MKRIEIEFAIDVEMTEAQEACLTNLVAEIATAHTPTGSVHWLAGGGLKPLWSEADVARFPDIGGGRNGKPNGEPDFDEETLYFRTECRTLYPGEKSA